MIFLINKHNVPTSKQVTTHLHIRTGIFSVVGKYTEQYSFEYNVTVSSAGWSRVTYSREP